MVYAKKFCWCFPEKKYYLGYMCKKRFSTCCYQLFAGGGVCWILNVPYDTYIGTALLKHCVGRERILLSNEQQQHIFGRKPVMHFERMTRHDKQWYKKNICLKVTLLKQYRYGIRNVYKKPNFFFRNLSSQNGYQLIMWV